MNFIILLSFIILLIYNEALAQGWASFSHEGTHSRKIDAEGGTNRKSKKRSTRPQMSYFSLNISEEQRFTARVYIFLSAGGPHASEWQRDKSCAILKLTTLSFW